MLMLTAASCMEIAPAEQGTVIAQVGSKILTLEMVEERIPPNMMEARRKEAIERYRKNWINRELLAQEARRLGMDRHEAVMQKIMESERDILAQALIAHIVAEVSREPVSRADAQGYYEENKEQFVLRERHVRYRHIRTVTLEDSRNAKAALQRGRPWEEVARRFDVDPERTLRHANLFFPQSLAAVDYNLMHGYLQRIGITEITPIHRIGDYFHFVQLMEDRAAGDHPDVDWILDQIEEWLRLDRKQRRINAFERNLMLQAESNNEVALFNVF